MADAITLRFWLEVLNLTWGDYILFERFPIRFIKDISLTKPAYAASIDRFLHQFPTSFAWFVLFILVNIGHHMGHYKHGTRWRCMMEARLYTWAGLLLALMLLLSFIPFMPGHDLLASDPLIRQIQQATKYFQVGDRPPRMLYVTDGGVKDCTALLQLLRRRCKRILLVLAALDPEDDLNVLRTAFQEAFSEKLAHCFNPKEPRFGVEMLFEEFKKDRSIGYLHLGISYCWDEGEESNLFGDLYIVKNRLPPTLRGNR